jgi:hypothetical protein
MEAPQEGQNEALADRPVPHWAQKRGWAGMPVAK